MASFPLISVVMPVYNREAFLPSAIESILAQTYENLELILADDGSSDRSADLIREFAGQDRRIVPLFLPRQGLAKTFNAAVSKASGEMIARQDSDDIALPDRLMRQYLWMHENNLQICGCLANITGSRASDLGWKDGVTRLPETHDAIVRALLFHVALWGGTLMAKAGVFRDNPFNDGEQFTDTAWPFRMVQRYTVGNLQDALISVRRHGANVSEEKKERFVLERAKARFSHFYTLFPKTPLKDYLAFARLADGAPMASLDELETAGHWLVKLTRHPDTALRERALKRWQKTCDLAMCLGDEVNCICVKIERLIQTTHQKGMCCL